MKPFLLAVKYTALVLYIVVVVFPIAWMGLSSFKSTREIYQSPWSRPTELSERSAKLLNIADGLYGAISALPEQPPTTKEEALEAALIFDALAAAPDQENENGGPLVFLRAVAPEMRDTGKYTTRSQNLARDLRAFAEEEPQQMTRRLEDDYTDLRAALTTTRDQVLDKGDTGVLSNYYEAWTTTQIGKAFLNSLLVSIGTMLVLIPIAAMASYVLAKYRFRGSNSLYMLFLGGMMFPQFLVIVPLFLQMSSLGLDDSLFGLTLVYIAFSLPFTVFVLTGFFHQLPDELAEAAMLDGCGHQATFWKVMWPLAKPGLVVVTIFNIIGLWNEYNLALVLMRSRDGFTLPRALDSLQMTAQYLGDTGALMAAMVIVILPVLMVYWLLKDKIHEAMLAGAIKG